MAEGAPRYDGHLQARKLADAGIQVTAIPDSAVFAMMARANKVCRSKCDGKNGRQYWSAIPVSEPYYLTPTWSGVAA